MKLHGFHIYKGEIPFDQLEVPPLPIGVEEDYEWASTDLQVQREFVGRVVAVFDRKVLGAGRTSEEAIAQALQHPDCPARARLVLVDVIRLSGIDNGASQSE